MGEVSGVDASDTIAILIMSWNVWIGTGLGAWYICNGSPWGGGGGGNMIYRHTGSVETIPWHICIRARHFAASQWHRAHLYQHKTRAFSLRRTGSFYNVYTAQCPHFM